MSAYVVDRRTIDLILTAASDQDVERGLREAYPWQAGETIATDDDRREARSMLGRYLWCMNVRSVQYRYPSDAVADLPGPGDMTYRSGMQYAPMPEYEYRPTRIARTLASGMNPSKSEALRVIGAIHCYRYQSCELPEYGESAAERFVTRVECRMGTIVGEGWEYTEEEERTAPVSVLSLA